MDIDIDLPTSFKPKEIFDSVVVASTIRDDKIVRHQCGAYFQNMPVDEISGLAAIPYDKAEEYGFFKIDFLHVSILDQIKTKSEMRQLMAQPVNWSLLQQETVVSQLFQIKNHFDVVRRCKPSSIIELADVIAIIRPNKRKYLSAYCLDKQATRPYLYRHDGEDKSSFRKSHAIAYAHVVVLNMHLIERQINETQLSGTN